MTSTPEIKIRRAGPDDTGELTTRHLTDLINAVYAVAEAGMWKPGHRRTSEPEVEDLLKDGELILAVLGGEIIGCVYAREFDAAFDDGAGLAELGLLVVDPSRRGLRIGVALMEAAEAWARASGLLIMRLELLTPRDWEHPAKRFVHDWYVRSGYAIRGMEPFERDFSHFAGSLAGPSDFTIYHKDLTLD